MYFNRRSAWNSVKRTVTCLGYKWGLVAREKKTNWHLYGLRYDMYNRLHVFTMTKHLTYLTSIKNMLQGVSKKSGLNASNFVTYKNTVTELVG